ncbi:MAG TPA: hypothetical protein VMH00_17855, partial [Candidatus Limnocylindrales bacterium]|nr:hypothetical protein [Candidatus Limnocylindrales bacterium]
SVFERLEERSLPAAGRPRLRVPTRKSKRRDFRGKKRRDAPLGMTKFRGRAEKMGSGAPLRKEINKAISNLKFESKAEASHPLQRARRVRHAESQNRGLEPKSTLCQTEASGLKT